MQIVNSTKLSTINAFPYGLGCREMNELMNVGIWKMEGSSASRCTRSQVGPDWSAKESLILVNEIVAVEADCSKALSSYQKWKMISENCTALDVPRSVNQCRRKWDSLLADYNTIMRSRTNSYRFSESESLSPNFGHELFKAIDNFVKAKESQSDTDPDSDPEAEAEAELSEVIAHIGCKRGRRQSMPVRHCVEEKLLKSHLQERHQKIMLEEEFGDNHVKEKPQKVLVDKKPQKSCVKEKSLRKGVEGMMASSIEDKEQMMVAKLHENAKLIHNIVTENADYSAAEMNNVQSELLRHQGDKLIACLGEIVGTLDQFTNHV